MDPAGNPATGTARVKRAAWPRCSRAASSMDVRQRALRGCGNGVGKVPADPRPGWQVADE